MNRRQMESKMNQHRYCLTFRENCISVTRKMIKHDMRKIDKKCSNLYREKVTKNNIVVLDFDTKQQLVSFNDKLQKLIDQGSITTLDDAGGFDLYESEPIGQTLDALDAMYEGEIIENMLEYFEDIEDEYPIYSESKDCFIDATEQDIKKEFQKAGLNKRFYSIFKELWNENVSKAIDLEDIF
jgi:hypothetical protein